jgi:hypothetical protein
MLYLSNDPDRLDQIISHYAARHNNAVHFERTTLHDGRYALKIDANQFLDVILPPIIDVAENAKSAFQPTRIICY